MQTIQGRNKVKEIKGVSSAISPSSHSNNEAYLVDSFLHRLEIADAIEVSTSSDLLQRYNHVWENAHWFDRIQTIYPIDKKAKNSDDCQNASGTLNCWKVQDCPSSERLSGIKMMQESLLLYKYEASEYHRTSRPMNEVKTGSSSLPVNLSHEPLAMIDICSRLLLAAKQRNSVMALKSDLQVGKTLG